jgi:hypothetical protein
MILLNDRIVRIKALQLFRDFPKQMAAYTLAQAEELALRILRKERGYG